MHKLAIMRTTLVIKRHLNLYHGRYKVHIYSKPAPTTMLTPLGMTSNQQEKILKLQAVSSKSSSTYAKI